MLAVTLIELLNVTVPSLISPTVESGVALSEKEIKNPAEEAVNKIVEYHGSYESEDTNF